MDVDGVDVALVATASVIAQKDHNAIFSPRTVDLSRDGYCINSRAELTQKKSKYMYHKRRKTKWVGGEVTYVDSTKLVVGGSRSTRYAPLVLTERLS